MEENVKKVSPLSAMIICILLLITIFVGFAILRLPLQSIFFITISFTTIVALFNGFKLIEIEEMIIDGGKKATTLVFILMAVGCIIGSWIVSGIIPAIIYYGLKILTPATFLVTGLLICVIVSTLTGSSYTAIGTIGVALFGIGYGLGVNPALSAGMIVSGAIFGDKMSPFSDTTLLASATCEISVYAHIKSMLFTTIPALIISAIIYAINGISYGGEQFDLGRIVEITDALENSYNINPILLIIPVIIIILAIKKFPPVISLSISAIAGILAAFIFQGNIYDVSTILGSLAKGFSIDTGIAEVDKLLNRGGILSMLSTASLSLLALGFGEMLQRLGVLEILLPKIKSIVKGPRSLVVVTLFTCLMGGFVTATQILTIILTGELFKNLYTDMGIKRCVLSRTLEDGGTIFPFLIPWAAPAIYTFGVLGVSALEYGRYCYLAILCPLIALIYAITDKFIWREDSNISDGEQI